jgi:large subunit ribosomal protein L9
VDVILTQRVTKLGNIGDVVRVKNGFARNFLFPQKKAVRVTTEAQAQFELDKNRLMQENSEKKTLAESLAKDIDGKVIVVLRQAGDSGQLYGSVSARDIVAALALDGINHVERHDILIKKMIKELGVHEATLFLHPEVSVQLKINVALSLEEAASQLRATEKNQRKSVSFNDVEDTEEADKLANEDQL